MGFFQQAFSNMAEGLKDLSSLDVITFEGEVVIQGEGTPESFDKVMEIASANNTFKAKVIASTNVKMDGDITAFYDKDISPEKKQLHAELLDMGIKNRQATVDMVKDILSDVAEI